MPSASEGDDSEATEEKSAEKDPPDGAEGGRDLRRVVVLVAVGLILVLVGTALASWATTDGGEIAVQETTIETESGLDLTATVYEPPEASTEEPAPAVTLIHGRSAERDSMGSFAQELAKRGYVVVSVDQPGHRDSDPPIGADGWGGPAALSYTRSLETVDEGNVSLVGHSMGGFASLSAAAEYPDGYQSVVLVGSSWGPVETVDGVPEANETFPRNLAVVYGSRDEFTGQMYNGTAPGNLRESEKLASTVGTETPVKEGQVYGSLENDSARLFVSPPLVHNGMHRSTATVGTTVEWVSQTTVGTTSNPNAQDWQFVSFWHLLSLLGGLSVAVGVTGLVWRWFHPVRNTEQSGGASLRTQLGLTTLPAVTVMPLYGLGTVLTPVTRLTHQQLTHGYIVWAFGTIAIAAGVASWRFDLDRETVRQLVPERPVAGHAVGAAGAGAGALYLLVTVASTVPGSGFRGWLVWLVPLTLVRWLSVLVYVLPLTVGTIALAYSLDRAVVERSPVRDLGHGFAVACGGLVVLVLVQYLPLFLGVGMPVPALAPLALTALWVLFYMTVATVLAVTVTRLTGEPLAGGVLAGLVVTWLIAGTGAIYVAPL